MKHYVTVIIEGAFKRYLCLTKNLYTVNNSAITKDKLALLINCLIVSFMYIIPLYIVSHMSPFY